MNNKLSQWFHNPAELQDDLRILKPLRKGETTSLKFGFSEDPLPIPESHRMKNLEVVILLVAHKVLMGTLINLQTQLSGLWSEVR